MSNDGFLIGVLLALLFIAIVLSPLVAWVLGWIGFEVAVLLLLTLIALGSLL